jgi:hypothetical protein
MDWNNSKLIVLGHSGEAKKSLGAESFDFQAWTLIRFRTDY